MVLGVVGRVAAESLQIRWNSNDLCGLGKSVGTEAGTSNNGFLLVWVAALV